MKELNLDHLRRAFRDRFENALCGSGLPGCVLVTFSPEGEIAIEAVDPNDFYEFGPVDTSDGGTVEIEYGTCDGIRFIECPPEPPKATKPAQNRGPERSRNATKRWGR